MLSKKKIIAVVLFVLIGFAVFTFANPRNVEPATEPSTANEETKNVVDTTPEVNPTTPVVQPVIPVDNAPVITVEPALVKIVEGYDYDVLEGVTVTDDIDQNLTVTASVTESEDGYVVTYTAIDRSGNTATNTRTIVVLSPEGDEDGDHYTNEEEIENNSDFLDEEDTPEYDYRPTIDVSGITKTSMVYDTIKTLKAACEDEYYGTKGVTCTVDQSKVDFENVGTYEVLVTATDILGNEATTSFDYVVTIRPATVVIDNKTTTYGKEVELTYTSKEELANYPIGVVLTKEEGTDTGKYAITGTYTNTNYDVTFVNGTYTINKAKISISGSKKFLNVNAVYDGKEHTALLTGNLDKRLYVVYSNNTRVNAGTQEATATIKVKDEYKNNYYVSNGSAIKKATITVEKRDAKVIIDSKTTTYGNDVELTYTTENVVEGDDLNVVLTKEVGTDVGTYTITGTYDNDNYNVEFVNGTYTINKAKISISGSKKFLNVNAVYDGKEHTALLTGNLDKRLYVVYSNNTRVNAGTQEATATIKVKDEYKNNYYVSNGSAIKKATITVEKRDAKVIIDSKTTTYGNDVELTYTTENVVEGDDLNVVLTKEVGTDVGTYTITGTYDNDNYNVEFVNGTYTINKKLISIANVKFDDATFVYDTKEHEALVSGDLDDKLLVVYANNKRTEVGTQRAVASIVVKSEYANNYKVDATVQEYVKTANLTITKATPVLPELGNLEALEGDNLSSISLPEGYSFTEDKVLTLADDKEQNSETVNVKYCLADTTNYECVNTTATVVVKARLYTVTFMSDGSVYETQDVRVNKYATAPSVNPQKENYAFTGWDVDLANTPVTSAMTVNAQFTAGQLKIEISEKPNANFVFKQDPTNTSDKAIRDLIIVKKVYADGTKVETTSYKTNFDIKTTGEKVLLVTDDEGFTATHEYKVIVNVAFQTKFEVILNEKDATGKNSYRKTTDSSCTSNCDLSNKTHSVDLNANTLEVIEHYDENIVVTNIKATYANESNKNLNISSRQRWSRYTAGAWYDPMRLAYLTKQVKVGEEEVCDFWLFICLSSHKEDIMATVYDDVMESTNLIKYVDVTYDRTFSNGYEKSYVVRFEYNSTDKKFTAISERQI